MSHDLRQAMGYRHIPASDLKEQELRDALFAARAAWVEGGSDISGPQAGRPDRPVPSRPSGAIAKEQKRIADAEASVREAVEGEGA